MLYVADNANHLIRAVDTATGAVTTIAGSAEGDADGPGLKARFDHPTGIAVAPDGRIFVLSSSSRKVKVILPDAARTVVTIAGGNEGFADGSGAQARLSPQAGATWAGTFLAVSDAAGLRVRGLVPGTNAAMTQAYTLAFSGQSGSSDGPAAEAAVALPTGLAAADDGSIYVADGAKGTIRVIRRPP